MGQAGKAALWLLRKVLMVDPISHPTPRSTCSLPRVDGRKGEDLEAVAMAQGLASRLEDLQPIPKSVDQPQGSMSPIELHESGLAKTWTLGLS